MAARALILANGVFADPAIPRLVSPVPDGGRLKALLERADVFPYEATLAPDLGAQAAREAVAEFCHGADAGDQLLLFISGHGLKDAHGKLYFATADSWKTKLKATTLEARFVIECMQESAAERQLVFLDTCYSGAFARGVTPKSAAQSISKEDFGGDWQGRAVVTATTAVQLAAEAEADGFMQSRFTRALIDAIENGRADRGGRGQIRLDELFAHIGGALKGTGQTPQLFSDKLAGEIVIAKNPAAVALPEEVVALLASPNARERGLAVDTLAAIARTEATVLARVAVGRLRVLEEEDDSSLVRAAAMLALQRLKVPPVRWQDPVAKPPPPPALVEDFARLVRLWEMKFDRPIETITFSPDDAYVLTGSDDNTVRLWDAGGAELSRFVGHRDLVWSVAFSTDGARVLTGSRDKTARLWDAASGAVLKRFTGHEGEVRKVAFALDGARVLTGSDDKTARLWDAASGAELRRFEGHGGCVNGVAFSPDGARVLTGSYDATARLWNAASGAELKRFQGHRSCLKSVAFSPDGSRVITGSDDKTARLWDAVSGAELKRYEGHGSCVNNVAFSPDGARVLTDSYDATARLWDAASGAELGRFELPGNEILRVAFSPDGARVLTGAEDGTARLWGLPSPP